MAARFSILFAWIATILLLVPFLPEFPFATLDASWKFALNEAIARHLVFGQDLIFGFGPLASVYIRMYHPGTDAAMIGFGVLFALALAVGCSSLSRSNRPYLLFGLPVFLPQILLFDAVFLLLPFVLLLLVTRWSADEPQRHKFLAWAEIALVGTAVALLPLVKGSFTGAVLACGGLAWILIARKSIVAGAASLLWAAAAMAITWCMLGQPLQALPGFFLAQGPIIAGYGEAMSTKGPMLQVVLFVVAAVITVKSFSGEAMVRFGKAAAAPTLGMILVLFVAFKSGFVRHDVHALIAASALLFAAYLSLLMFRTRRIAISMLISLLLWAFIAYRHVDLSPRADLLRLTTALRDSGHGIAIRLSGGEVLQQKFDESLQVVRQLLPLPPFDGTVDLYPAGIAAILAEGQKWSPRPILQSYSAYTPGLLDLNRRHLTGVGAPDRIYFTVSPIDGHYPSTEDGASWLELMSRYRVGSFFGPYAVLEKRSAPVPLNVDDTLLEVADGRLGTPIEIPSTGSPIWARIQVAPSWIGSIYGTLFKLPPLRLTIRYRDATAAEFRFIPGTAKAGFVLSPTVQTASAFAALQRSEREQYFRARRLSSFEISTKLGIQRLLWKRHFDVRLSAVDVKPDPDIPPDTP